MTYVTPCNYTKHDYIRTFKSQYVYFVLKHVKLMLNRITLRCVQNAGHGRIFH
jgi:hypothetical protein